MANVEIVKSEWCDIYPIAEDMRPADIQEVAAASDTFPDEALILGYEHSENCWTVLVDGQPSAMFGVGAASILSGVGIPWLLGTNRMLRVKRVFFTKSKPYLTAMLSTYPILKNYVDARNKASIRWLRWLGFTIQPPVMYGVHAELFHPFVLERPNV